MKTLLLTLVLGCSTLLASAQFEVRPFIGANFSNVSKTPDGNDTRAKLGGQFGASVLIGNKLHLMPGIALFSRSTEYTNNVSNVKTEQNISGVIVPLLLGYRFMDPTTEPFLNFRIWTGPSVMFLTKTEFGNSETNEAVDWKNNQWGYQVGAGLDIAMVFVDLGYEVGLSEAGSLAEGVDTFTSIKNNTFFVNVGVRLSLSK